MKLCVVGTGYVGLVSGTCLASVGHQVACVDVDAAKVERINRGEPPIHEDGLEALLKANVGTRLRATTSLADAMDGADVALICVGPPFDGKTIDLSYVLQVSREIGKVLKDQAAAAKAAGKQPHYCVVTVKSTVVPGTTDTVVRKANLNDMEDMCRLMTELGIVFWEVFFLVPMGRARKEDVASAEGFEAVFNQLYDLSKTASFDIKATAAPQYSRVVMQRKRAEARAGADTDLDVLTSGMHYSQQDGIGRARNVNDGDGFMFISHVGDIYPSGFLPIKAGNVRTDDIEEVYRYSPLFTTLRDRSQLKGKCGICSYRSFCGGSRARAYAMTGDFLAEEPFCSHEPRRPHEELPA